MLATLHCYLGDDLKIHVDLVENVDMARTGKRLATVSRLGIDFQQVKASSPQPGSCS